MIAAHRNAIESRRDRAQLSLDPLGSGSVTGYYLILPSCGAFVLCLLRGFICATLAQNAPIPGRFSTTHADTRVPPLRSTGTGPFQAVGAEGTVLFSRVLAPSAFSVLDLLRPALLGVLPIVLPQSSSVLRHCHLLLGGFRCLLLDLLDGTFDRMLPGSEGHVRSHALVLVHHGGLHLFIEATLVGSLGEQE